MITPKSFGAEALTSAVRDTLWCMFYHGPTWDGDLPSKTGRDWLVNKGFAARGMGWNWLSADGVLLAIEIGMGTEKERKMRIARPGGE